MSQLCASAVNGEVPVDLGLAIVPVCLPGGHVSLKHLHIRNSLVQALPIQCAEFDLCHVEPTAVLRCVMDVKAFSQPSSLVGLKRLVERGQTVCVQAVENQAHLDSVWVSFIEHPFDPPRPISSRPVLG